MTSVQQNRAAGRLPAAGAPRHPWKQWALTIVTLGVYAAVHHFRTNRELRDFGIEVDPVKATLAFVPGCVLVVPYLITVYRTCQRVAVAQETVGIAATARPELAVVASLFSFLHVPYQQAQLNRVWVSTTESDPS